MSQTSQYDFGKNLKELEAITAWFESDEVDLDQALAKYERGMQLAADLKQHLQQVENKVKKIRQKFDGTPTPETEIISASEDDAPELFGE